MKRIIAQTRKELTQFSRDRLTVVLALVLPVILMWLIGSSVSLTVSDLPVVVQDWDQTPTSRRYVEAIGASLTFRVVPLPITRRPRVRSTSQKHAPRSLSRRSSKPICSVVSQRKCNG